ncbi:hypothetical protein GCU67_20970 [Modestobacter muralis]|uniref:Excalibur calcium-binding domain-containing protein n=2 Tax=Modestobacter muralis TaxID=1608614 RepID=A0A6P0F146_9ACTN|nr:hypothetical protein [Modestobacter muralis]NEN53538.1 hypothetical protein [Modestobacter muralis]
MRQDRRVSTLSPLPTSAKSTRKRKVLTYGATALVAFGVGAAGGGGQAEPVAAERIEVAGPTVTMTAPAPAPVTVTQTAPAPAPATETVTVTETAEAPAAAAAPAPRTSTAIPVPTPAAPREVSYANCTEVRNAGAAPIRRGEPGYSSKLDRDGDGIACDT